MPRWQRGDKWCDFIVTAVLGGLWDPEQEAGGVTLPTRFSLLYFLTCNGHPKKRKRTGSAEHLAVGFNTSSFSGCATCLSPVKPGNILEVWDCEMKHETNVFRAKSCSTCLGEGIDTLIFPVLIWFCWFYRLFNTVAVYLSCEVNFAYVLFA